MGRWFSLKAVFLLKILRKNISFLEKPFWFFQPLTNVIAKKDFFVADTRNENTIFKRYFSWGISNKHITGNIMKINQT